MGRLTNRDRGYAAPPRWAEGLLSRFSPAGMEDELQGDLLEMYTYWVKTVGPSRARWRYALTVLRMIRPFCRSKTKQTYQYPQPLFFSSDMIRNYFTVAWRNLLRYKGYTALNLVGLTAGLTCVILVGLYIWDELSYDRFHKNADRIYRVTRDFVDQDGNVNLHLGLIAAPFAPRLQTDFPEIEQAVRLLGAGASLAFTDKLFNENNMFFAEKNLFKVFSFQVHQGNRDQALAEPYTVMFSEPMARKYFGSENPIGKTVRVAGEIDLVVTGVFEPLPAQSHFHPNFLISLATAEDERINGKETMRSNFGANGSATYLLLPENYDVSRLQRLFPAFIDKHLGKDAHKWTRLYLQKLTDIHLHSHLGSELEANSDSKYVTLFALIGFFILILACINYTNLATARSARRAKEIGLRKVIGAEKWQLATQFQSESVLLTCGALVLAVALSALLLPTVNTFSGKAIAMAALFNPYSITALVGLVLLTGLLAGGYPALYLTSLEPLNALKNQRSQPHRSNPLRQSLVVVQFSVAIFLLIGTAVVFEQLRFIQSKKLGYRKEQMVILPNPGKDLAHAFEQALMGIPGVTQVAFSSKVPSDRLLDMAQIQVPATTGRPAQKRELKVLYVDHDFLPTYEMRLLAGRSFSRQYPSDDSTAFVLNQRAVKLLGWSTPREAVNAPLVSGTRQGRIIGVIEDVHFESLQQSIEPLVMIIDQGRFNSVTLKLSIDEVSNTLARAKNIWQQFQPHSPFEYQFLDQNFQRLYQTEQTRGQLFTAFTIVALLIACLGLLGLAAYTAEQRTKEIGVRKALGASVSSVVGLLAKDFLKPVFIAILIASPVAWYTMRQWLQGFAYRIDMEGWYFALAGLLAIGIALLTVSFQSIKAALMNPVKALGRE